MIFALYPWLGIFSKFLEKKCEGPSWQIMSKQCRLNFVGVRSALHCEETPRWNCILKFSYYTHVSHINLHVFHIFCKKYLHYVHTNEPYILGSYNENELIQIQVVGGASSIEDFQVLRSSNQ